MKRILLSVLILLLGIATLPAPPILLGNDPSRTPGGSSIRNLRVTEQSPDGTEAVLTMDYVYDGLAGVSAFVIPVISQKKDKKVSVWFGADPQTVGRGRGIVSIKVRFFNDEPGVPSQLTTDTVRILLMNSSRRYVVTTVPFYKTINWGSANAQKLTVAEPAAKAKTKEQIAAEEEAKRLEASRLKAESEARARKELERRAKAEAKAREAAQLKAESEAKRLAEEKAKAQAEAKRLADERQMAEAKAKAEAAKREQERMLAEANAKKIAEEKKLAEAKAKAEAALREQARLKAAAEAKARMEAEARARAEAAAREAEAKKLAEEKRQAEQMAKAEAEATKRKQLEAEAKAKQLAEDAARQKAAEETKRMVEIQTAAQAAAKEADRLKVEEAARIKDESRIKAEIDARQKELEAKLAAVRAQIKEADNAEAKAKADAEKAVKKALAEAETKEAAARKALAEAQMAKQQKVEAQSRAKKEGEAGDVAQKKAEEEEAALAKAKEQIRKQAEEAAKLASSATAVIEVPPDIKSEVLNMDVVNRSLDRSEMTIGVEFDYNDKFGSKPLLGVAVAKTGIPQASEYFNSDPMEIKRSRKETVLIPVKFRPPAGQAVKYDNYATDRMLVYMADGATAKQVNLFAATMYLVWRPPAAPVKPSTTIDPKDFKGSLEIDRVRQEDVYTGYVTLKYSLPSGKAKLRVRLFQQSKPESAEWFLDNTKDINPGSGVELFKVAVDPNAKTTYDLISIDMIVAELLTPDGQVLITKRFPQPMSWVKPK